jgi:hypothetical protein
MSSLRYKFTHKTNKKQDAQCIFRFLLETPEKQNTRNCPQGYIMPEECGKKGAAVERRPLKKDLDLRQPPGGFIIKLFS